jgi:hypothetical protein
MEENSMKLKRVLFCIMPMLCMVSYAFGSGGLGAVDHLTNLDTYPTITGTYDLNNASMIETGADLYTPVAAYIGNAYNNGWSIDQSLNVGITSGYAQTTGVTALVPATAADFDSVGGAGTFWGTAYTSTDTLVLYSWAGDSNMDGLATTEDDDAWTSGYYWQLSEPTKTDFHYIQGDFNYDGLVTTEDEDLWTASYYSQLSDPSIYYGDPFAAVISGGNIKAVPEPSTVILLLTCVGSMFIFTRKFCNK